MCILWVYFWNYNSLLNKFQLKVSLAFGWLPFALMYRVTKRYCKIIESSKKPGSIVYNVSILLPFNFHFLSLVLSYHNSCRMNSWAAWIETCLVFLMQQEPGWWSARPLWTSGYSGSFYNLPIIIIQIES